MSEVTGKYKNKGNIFHNSRDCYGITSLLLLQRCILLGIVSVELNNTKLYKMKVSVLIAQSNFVIRQPML